MPREPKLSLRNIQLIIVETANETRSTHISDVNVVVRRSVGMIADVTWDHKPSESLVINWVHRVTYNTQDVKTRQDRLRQVHLQTDNIHQIHYTALYYILITVTAITAIPWWYCSHDTSCTNRNSCRTSSGRSQCECVGTFNVPLYTW